MEDTQIMISIICPFYNEEDTIQMFFKELLCDGVAENLGAAPRVKGVQELIADNL